MNEKSEKGLKIFKRFLKERGIYALYLKEAKNNKSRFSSLNSKFGGNLISLLKYYNDCPTLIIDRSLHWINTIHGDLYWQKVESEFKDYYRKYNL